MYGFSGIGTNAYASLHYPQINGPLFFFPMNILQLPPVSSILQPLKLVQNDYGFSIPFTLNDANGDPVNLADAALSFNVQSGQDATDELVDLSGFMVIDNAAEGTCHYQVASGDFPNPGTFLATVVASWAGSETLTWLAPQLIVKPALPQSMN